MTLRELKRELKQKAEDLETIIFFETDENMIELYIDDYIECIVLLRKELDRALIILN